MNIMLNSYKKCIINGKNSTEYDLNFTDSKIPNIIWTYWDSNIPETVNKCINTWRNYNPTYTIIVLNKDNLSTYLPEVDFINIKNIESPQHFSDMVRLCILAKEGGIWCDASIICLSSYDWIHQLQQKYNSEYVGYYLNSFTLKKYLKKSPVIENWFFACIKDSKFVSDWKNEYLLMTTYNNRLEYINDVILFDIDIQKINNPEYLTMHVSAQKVLQYNNHQYKLVLLEAEEDAYKYLIFNSWNSTTAVKSIIESFDNELNKIDNNDLFDTNIIKLRKCERSILDDYYNKFDLK